MARLINSKVTYWEADLFGVSFEYSDGHRVAYAVGSWNEARLELVRVKDGASANLPAKEHEQQDQKENRLH